MKKNLGKEWENVSLSSGTMLEDDIFNAIKDLLPKKMITEYENSKNEFEKSEYLNEDIWLYLNDISPEGFYFGAHLGNGSDFGFWEFIEEDFMKELYK